MATILDRLVADTREHLAVRRREVPVSSLRSYPDYDNERRSFREALSARGLSIIAECKQASPSRGRLADTYDPAGRAEAYVRGGAAAVSVLTEPRHFLGDPAHVTEVRGRIDQPILRKDFIVDPYQIVESRAIGADAVLLIAAVLEGSRLADLHAAADEERLDVLVEIHDPRELDEIDLDRVSIVGVNSRDLRTFEVDVASAVRTLETLPGGLTRVAESGISSNETLLDLQRRGIDAALIGEAFMRARDPSGAVAAFTEALESTRPVE